MRPKYIPHKSDRAKLTQQGISGWNAIPAGKEDDDVMSLDDATYRMCYKITDLPFGNTSTVTNQTLYVYADEYVVRDGFRSATVRFSFYKDGGDSNQPEVRNFTISQDGYLSFYTNDDSQYAGLRILNQDGTPSDVKQRMVLERYPEYRMTMNPGIDPSVQNINSMQWGFAYQKIYVSNNLDKFRNGRFVTTESVYIDLKRVDNEPDNFGVSRIRTGICSATGWTAIWRLYRPIPEGLPAHLIIFPTPLRIFITPYTRLPQPVTVTRRIAT